MSNEKEPDLIPLDEFQEFFIRLQKDGYTPQQIFSSLMATALSVVEDITAAGRIEIDPGTKNQVTITFDADSPEEAKSICFNLGNRAVLSQEDQ